MPDQPPFPPPQQPPFQPSYPGFSEAPTQAPGLGPSPWAQQPGGYGPPPAPPGGGRGRTPWGLVVGALVAGLVVGGAVAGGVVALTAEDPEDSAEYQALEDELAEARAGGSSSSSSPSSPSSPSPEGGSEPGATQDVEGWEVTEPEISEDALGDFTATMTATNRTGSPAVAYFQVVVSKGSVQLTEMFCSDEETSEVADGDVAVITCFTSDDYTDDYDSVVVQAGF